MSKCIIRQAADKDLPEIMEVVKAAFIDELYSNQDEHFLVERLTKAETFIPELSLVGVIDDIIVGYILLTPITIGANFTALSLAPVAILPEHQGEGLGAELILKSHEVARNLGYKAIVLFGHKDYYPRFGYKQMAEYGISIPNEAPQEYCLCLELVPNALSGVSGRVNYPKAFFA